METLDLSVDAGAVAGLLLAMTRVAAFVVASPMLARLVPAPGRLAVIVVLGLNLASPLPGEPTLAALAGAAMANAAVGAALGYLTGVLFHLFAVAGGLVDLSSGLTVAALFDPTMGEQAAVMSRLFNIVALALFFVTGGIELLVRGLDGSVALIPLDAGLAPSGGLAELALDLTGRLLVLGAELALPILSALFLVEVVLGLASRFAPQANVFLLGLPAKIVLTLSVTGGVLLLFPDTMDSLSRAIAEIFTETVRGLALPA